MSKMMFRKKTTTTNENTNGSSTPSNQPKMTPLNIPGVVERGQCLKCAHGNPAAMSGGGRLGSGSGSLGDTNGNGTAVAIGTAIGTVPSPVKAIPINAVVDPHDRIPSPPTSGGHLKSPPPQSAANYGEVDPWGNNNNTNAKSPPPLQAQPLVNGHRNDLKQPPEILLGLNSSATKASPDDYESSSEEESGSSESGSSSSGSYETDEEESIGDIEEDLTKMDLGITRLDSDHASSYLVNNLKQNDKQLQLNNLTCLDDRKPAAKPAASLYGDFGEADFECLERSTNSQTDGNKEKKMTCPSGMSPEVFYELPPEMQREVLEQDSRQQQQQQQQKQQQSKKKSSTSSSSAASTTTTDMDPETLASLPDDIRREVLEQARREQQQKLQQESKIPAQEAATNPGLVIDGISLPPERKLPQRTSLLSESTTAFLSNLGMTEKDYESFPDDIKNEIQKEKKRVSDGDKLKQQMTKVLEEAEDLDLSGFDPETLASLPEDVRKEVLDNERRECERRRRDEQSARRHSLAATPGAHSVHVPAGYDPETFSALPDDVQQELLEDATRQAASGRRFSADAYDYGDVVDATVVQARPIRSSTRGGGGTATSCTYTGEYNVYGKRHGDGDLVWANGDKYVGKFKDGYIDGRGTIAFHDGKCFCSLFGLLLPYSGNAQVLFLVPLFCLPKGTEYAGQWKKNRFHGEGTRRFNNGNVYTGNYGSGKRQGQGRCYFANGDMYVGDWKDDTIHGFGRYYYNNGHRYELCCRSIYDENHCFVASDLTFC